MSHPKIERTMEMAPIEFSKVQELLRANVHVVVTGDARDPKVPRSEDALVIKFSLAPKDATGAVTNVKEYIAYRKGVVVGKRKVIFWTGLKRHLNGLRDNQALKKTAATLGVHL